MDNMDNKEEKNEIDSKIIENDLVKFKGHYISATGRRKSSIAVVRLYKKGNGSFAVNDKKISDYFNGDKANIVKQPLKLSGHLRDLNISIKVSGGGEIGQAEAVRHAITKGLIEIDPDLKPSFKAKGWTTRDARIKERKKPGLKKARRAPQWAKR
jgi:small subunit ribosomal protein S9